MLRQLAALLRAYASMVPQLLAISAILGLSIPSGHCHPQGPSGSGATARNVHPLHDEGCSNMHMLSKSANGNASAT